MFAVASWALILVLVLVAPRSFTRNLPVHSELIVSLVAVFAPLSLAVWWIFRRLQSDRSRSDARRAATAFAVSAPLALVVGNVLGVLVGGYAEAWLGRYFILPAIAAFIITMMIFVPSGVVMWALHPSGGVGPTSEK